MARFDVHRNGTGNLDVPFLLDIQSDVLSEMATRLVVPLVPVAIFGTPITRLNPVFTIKGQKLVMATAEMAGVDRRILGEPVASLGKHHDEIVDAVDFLLQGF